MSAFLDPCIDLKSISDATLLDVIEKAKDWAVMHGVGMRSKTNFNPDVLQFAPFVLLPSVLPRKEFERAINLQLLINELVHKIAHDYDFLKATLATTIQVDAFTGKLFEIYEKVRAEGITQPLCLGMVRSDIMLESVASKGRSQAQVEVNTIAAGFGWLGPVSSHIQRFILGELGHADKCQNLPENSALQSLAGAMLQAWSIYNKPKAVILFIIENVTYNICDQRFHEFEIRKQNPNVRVIRRNLTEMGTRATLDPHTKALLIDEEEVAVVYFRSGYVPDQYPSHVEWDGRLIIERSLAIKSPTIHYHLTGTKKVQQELAKKGVLERFMDDPQKIAQLRECFAGLYSLDLNEEGDAAAAMAIADPTKFVLKPQREGGGNNAYGEEVATVLRALGRTPERAAYILMDVIEPPHALNYLIRPGAGPGIPPVSETVGELGIFGVIIGDEKNVVKNIVGGHMLRTKLCTANEGGVAAGLGALDSPYLLDMEPSEWQK